MNILVFAREVPATPGMPGSPRLFSLCRELSKRHRLTLATFTQGSERYQALLDDPMAAGVFEETALLPNPPDPGWRGQQLHRLRQELHFSTRVRHSAYHEAICGTIRDMTASGGFDVVFADGLRQSQYIADARIAAPAVIDTHDCVTLLYSRKATIEHNWWRKLLLRAEVRSIARWERSLGRTFKAVIVNSPVDAEFLRSLDPAAHVVTIGNGVDSDYFRPSDGPGDPTALLFTGVMTYGPNEDAALYFCESILPLIQERYPEARMSVVGKDPSEKVRALAALPGVDVAASVPDVRPYLEGAGIFVCPLRYGAGVKNKLLAALAMEKAVVATRLSIEGLEVEDGHHLLVADSAGEFAAQVLRLIADPALARRLGVNGRAFVNATHSWESSGRMLEDTLTGIVAPHR